MKKVITLFALIGFALVGTADEIKGKGVCAKCSLKEADSCQAVVQVTKDGETTNYYVNTDSKMHKKLHKAVCKKDVEGICIKGAITEVDGKKVVDATEAAIPKKK
jgi:hypothetical protein